MGLIDSALGYWELIANLEKPSYWITNNSREVRPCIPEYFSIVLSPPRKVRCNKIATAGIINELEWVRREELISYLWDTNELATSLTVLLMIFSGPQAIPSRSLSLSQYLSPFPAHILPS